MCERSWHFKSQCYPHVETSQLICTVNQLTGFYVRATLALNGLTDLILELSLLHINSPRKDRRFCPMLDYVIRTSSAICNLKLELLWKVGTQSRSGHSRIKYCNIYQTLIYPYLHLPWVYKFKQKLNMFYIWNKQDTRT